MTYTLPDLPYKFDALEPHIDAKTMEIHHGKHHAGYVSKLNAALEGKGVDLPIKELISSIHSLPINVQKAVQNNGGGHYNHSLFWESLTPNPTAIPDVLQAALVKSFGSIEVFKAEFSKVAASRFGSGWAWLVVQSGDLALCSTANQDNPLMGNDLADCFGIPILGLDVWEHAYYLHYQNRRPDYIDAFFNLVNWDVVAERYAAATA